jgi:hypothetical protein
MEIITFDKGINTKRNPLVLEDGEMVSCSGFVFDSMGDLFARTPKSAVSTSAVGNIHTIHRYKNYVILGDDKQARFKWDLDGYCDLYVPPNGNFTLLGSLNNSNAWRIVDAEDFVFWVNGQDSKAFCGCNWYEWNIQNPTQQPKGTAGSTGQPNDTYSLYYTFLITFPNGRVYETGLSPAASVTVSSQIITWSDIGICGYAGPNLTIHRKLYRTSASLIDIFYVGTISDNTTTTYSDNIGDTALEISGVVETEGMGGIPEGMTDIAYHLNRVFGIKGSILYPSEPYLPFTFDPGKSIQITRAGIDLVAVETWGDQLYLASKDKWYRLQGTTSSTWNIKNTFAENGTINHRSVQPTKQGLISQWYDGIYLFDGLVTTSLTKNNIPATVFTGMTSPSSAYSSFDGKLYKFYYPSTGTTINKCLTIDLEDYPKMKFSNDDFLSTAAEFHFPTGIHYYGKSGLQYEDGVSETFSASLQTGDRASKDLPHQKGFEYLYYDIDTNSKDVVLTFYIDGIAQSPTITINTPTRKRDRITLPNWQGYRFSLKIDCADAQNLHIYSPWSVSATPFGA